MKRNGLLVLLFAAMTMCLTSCGKETFEKVDTPTFSALFAYLNKDFAAVKAEFESKSFDITEGTEGEWYAEKEDDDYSETYIFTVRNGIVVSAQYGFDAAVAATALVTGKSPVKNSVQDMLAAEKEFRGQAGMTQYSGYITTMTDDEDETTTDYSKKDDFIAAVKNLAFKNLSEASSNSTYSDVKTEVSFDFTSIRYSVAL